MLIFKKVDNLIIKLSQKVDFTSDVRCIIDSMEGGDLLDNAKVEEIKSNIVNLHISKLDSLKEVKEFIKREICGNARLIYFLNEGEMNYKKTAVHFNTKVSTMQVYIYREANKIEGKVGNIIDEIVGSADINSLSDCMNEFRGRIGTLTSKGLFLEGVTDMLPKPQLVQGISIKDCTEELKVLKTFSIVGAETLISKVDRGKLAFLLELMQSKSKFRELLVGYLKGDINRISELYSLVDTINSGW